MFTGALATQAAMFLTLESGATTVVIPGAGGFATYSGTIGSFIGTYTFATSNSPGTATRGLLQVSSINVRNTSSGIATLRITLQDTDYTAPGKTGDLLTLQSSIGGTIAESRPGDTVVFQSWADSGNAPLAIASTAGPQVYASDSNVLQSYEDTVISPFFRGGASYSLANVTTVTLSAGAQTNISGTTSVLVPEPASLSAVGMAVIGLVARRRRI